MAFNQKERWRKQLRCLLILSAAALTFGLASCSSSPPAADATLESFSFDEGSAGAYKATEVLTGVTFDGSTFEIVKSQFELDNSRIDLARDSVELTAPEVDELDRIVRSGEFAELDQPSTGGPLCDGGGLTRVSASWSDGTTLKGSENGSCDGSTLSGNSVEVKKQLEAFATRVGISLSFEPLR